MDAAKIRPSTSKDRFTNTTVTGGYIHGFKPINDGFKSVIDGFKPVNVDPCDRSGNTV